MTANVTITNNATMGELVRLSVRKTVHGIISCYHLPDYVQSSSSEPVRSV